MAHKVLSVIACLAVTFVVACNKEAGQKASSVASPSGPAAAVQNSQHKGEGVVKALNPNAPSIEINHGDIDGLMPAMQMEFPVTDANLLKGLAVNDRIEFTVENAPEGMKVVAIKKYEPAPATQKAP
ncbi:MAG TPA: copper-binding protein [Pyrinomonadaceae bacterium]|jgi:Cu/Ag efflux protein CusF